MHVDHPTARLSDAREANYQATLELNGENANTKLEVAFVLHAIFPNLRFALSDITPDDPELGIWLVPIPNPVAASVMNDRVDFGWSEPTDESGVVSIYIPSPR